MYSVEIFDLAKVYGKTGKKNNVRALQNLSLSVDKGSIFGLLGPNGAGKTTLIKILLGITNPTRGTANILGEKISNFSVRSKVGYLPENHKFPNYLKGNEVLKYYARLGGVTGSDIVLQKKIDELLGLVKMLKWKKTKIKNYSKGMMQRLGLAQALINDPDLIFLDEPTDGVDPIGRKEIRDILITLKEKGKTIFLNSHLLSEIELVCDKVAILHKGALLKEGTVDDLTSSKEEYLISTNEDIPQGNFNGIFTDFKFKKINSKTLSFKVNDNSELNRIIDIIRREHINIVSISPQKNSLEDMFISLINETEHKN